MSHPYHHAQSSARKYGGDPEDYLQIHSWFDGSKSSYANFRHRALRHHAFGIFEAEKIFGVTLRNSAARTIPVRFIGEQHVREDCGGIIPTVQDWLRQIPAQSWMSVGKLAGDKVSFTAEGTVDLSVEKWREVVVAGETVLGYAEWAERTRLMADSDV